MKRISSQDQLADCLTKGTASTELPRVDRLCRDICSYVCPQTWLTEARLSKGLSPTIGFLN